MPQLNGLQFEIPQGYFDIPDECIVKKDDQIAMVAIKREKTEQNPIIGNVVRYLHWLKVDDTEIGKIKKYSGKVVIRKI